MLLAYVLQACWPMPYHVLKDLKGFVKLPVLAVCRDQGSVGGGSGLGACGQHALIHLEGLLGLPAHVAGNDDRVVGANLWLNALQQVPE